MSIKLFDTYGTITLGETEFLFDIEDLPVIRGRDWYRDKDGYLASSYIFNGKRCFLMFHRIIMNARPQQFIDHINKTGQITGNKISGSVPAQKVIGTVADTPQINLV